MNYASKDKYSSSNNEEYEIDEVKPKGLSFLRQETEFFDEESYIPQDLINVRRINLPGNGEDWEILKNDEVALTIKGIRFTKKEKEFFRSINGISFLMNGYKNGWNSVSEFKRQVKKITSRKNKKRGK